MAGYAANQEPRSIVTTYKAYDPDGKFKGLVKLTWKRRQDYEAKGFRFEKRSGSHRY